MFFRRKSVDQALSGLNRAVSDLAAAEAHHNAQRDHHDTQIDHHIEQANHHEDEAKRAAAVRAKIADLISPVSVVTPVPAEDDLVADTVAIAD